MAEFADIMFGFIFLASLVFIGWKLEQIVELLRERNSDIPNRG